MITNEPEGKPAGLPLYRGPIWRGMRVVLRGGDVVTVAGISIAPDHTAFTTEELEAVYTRQHIQPDDTSALNEMAPAGGYVSTVREH